MSTWIKIKNKHRKIEILGLILMIICTAVGIIFDYTVICGLIFHEVKDINTFSLTLLQIQATISTLTIALVALMSGNISETYMGVSVSVDYYFKLWK